MPPPDVEPSRPATALPISAGPRPIVDGASGAPWTHSVAVRLSLMFVDESGWFSDVRTAKRTSSMYTCGAIQVRLAAVAAAGAEKPARIPVSLNGCWR